MTTTPTHAINFSTPSPELCTALSRFYAAKIKFAELVRSDTSTGAQLSDVAQEIAGSEEAIFHAIRRMAAPIRGDGT